jgi:hypothetical protein
MIAVEPVKKFRLPGTLLRFQSAVLGDVVAPAETNHGHWAIVVGMMPIYFLVATNAAWPTSDEPATQCRLQGYVSPSGLRVFGLPSCGLRSFEVPFLRI